MGGRLNLMELLQEEAAQMRELTHGTLCLGEGMPSDMVLKWQKYYKRIWHVNLRMRWLNLVILEIANDLRLFMWFVQQVKPLRQTSPCACHKSVWRRWAQRLMVGISAVCGPGICRRNSGRQGLCY